MAHVREVRRKTGTAYEMRWKDGDRSAQRTFSVRREAERFALKVETATAMGEGSTPTRSTKTFREVAELCIAADSISLKQKTLDGYEVALRVHLFPTLGRRRIGSITSQDVEAWLADLRAKPKANGALRTETSVLGTYKALAKVMRYAHAHLSSPITRAPVSAVRRPTPARHASYR